MADLSKWEIANEGKLTRNGYLGPDQPFTILHVDKDEAYRKEIYHHCIYPFFPSAIVFSIDQGKEAFDFVKEFIDNKTTVHLIITDIVLTGLGGLELIKKVREYECISGLEPSIPIIILSILPRIIVKNRFNGGQDLPTEHFFEKKEEAYLIAGILEELLYK